MQSKGGACFDKTCLSKSQSDFGIQDLIIAKQLSKAGFIKTRPT